MTARLSYGMRGHPAGTVVEVLPASDPRVQAAWAGISERHESDQIAIILPGRDTPTIAMVRELEFSPPPAPPGPSDATPGRG